MTASSRVNTQTTAARGLGLRKRLAYLGLVALSLVGLVACSGPPKISGQDPVIALDSMEITHQGLNVRVRISNVNDFTQALDGLSLELALAGFEPRRSRLPLQSVAVAATSREPLDFRFSFPPEWRDALGRLDRGELDRLPWTMRLIRDENRELSTAFGYLFTVPGQSGRFR